MDKKQKLETIGELTAIVAHELRNPLGTIRNSLYTIQNRINDQFIVDDVIDTAMERVSRNIDRCDSIVTELMDYARSSEPLLRKTNLHKLINDVIETIKQNKHITIYNEVEDDVFLNIDVEKMRRVFINLINNGVEAIMDDDFGPGYGIIKISYKETNVGVVVSVYDNGPGIPEESIEEIMEPLVSTKGFGIGLGLPIVQRLVEEHKGAIEIDTEVDMYTQINIHLPKHRIV